MDGNDLASGVAGVLLPALIAVVVRSNWPSWAKGVVAAGSSIVMGFLVALLSGQLDGKTWMQSALVIFGAAQVAYKVWWEPTGIAPAIEKATTPKVIEGETAWMGEDKL